MPDMPQGSCGGVVDGIKSCTQATHHSGRCDPRHWLFGRFGLGQRQSGPGTSGVR